MTFTLRKKLTFEAAHRLPLHDGKCARLHGHSWIAWIECAGDTLIKDGPKSGMLVDYGDISAAAALLREDFLDHHFLNETLGLNNPTSEEIARVIYNTLKPALPSLQAVTVEETCTAQARYEP